MTHAVTIWRNSACGTSRNTLAMIRAAGLEPAIVDYLKTPPTRAALKRAIADAGLSPLGVRLRRPSETVLQILPAAGGRSA